MADGATDDVQFVKEFVQVRDGGTTRAVEDAAESGASPADAAASSLLHNCRRIKS